MKEVFEKAKSMWKNKSEIAKHVIEIPCLYLKRHSELFEVPLDICMNPLGFSYGSDGWHPVTALLKELRIAGQVKDLENSVFCKFYEKYQPVNMLHLVRRFDTHVTFAPPMGVLPWGGFARKATQFGGSPLKKTSWLCGPLDMDSIKLNIERIVTLYSDMQQNGYAPWKIRNSFIEGCFLKSKEGGRRFIVMHGKHRAAVLSFLGFKKISVKYAPESIRVIREDNVTNWFYVKNKQCSIHDAIAYFHAYFGLTGKERAEELGLLD